MLPSGSAYSSRISHFQALNRSFSFVILLCHLVFATPRNITIDDQHGDEATGAVPKYDPPEAWANQDCQACRIRPDVDKLFGHTATAATYSPNKGIASNTIEFGFNGTAIYIFFTLFNFEGQGVAVNTECNFSIDDQKIGSFNHSGDPGRGDTRDYRTMVFSETNLSPEPHQMKISMSDVDYDLFLSFDYAIYTRDVDSSQSPPPVALLAAASTASQSSDPSPLPSFNQNSKISPGIIAGGVVGGLAVITGFVLLIYFYRRDIKRHQPPKSPPITVPRPFGIDAYSSSEQGQFRPYPPLPAPSNTSQPSLPRMSESSRSGRPLVTPTSSRRSRTEHSRQFPSVDGSASLTSHSHSQSSSSRSGSVEHRIQVAHYRMRSIRAELASVSGGTTPSSQSSRTSRVRGRNLRVAEELLEEVRRLREEIKELKLQQQRQQQQQRQSRPQAPAPAPAPADNEPPPIYTDEVE